MRRVVVDADVGIDDAIAIIYLAARHDAEIVAIGSVHGNCPGENATQNALYTLEVCGLNTPVAAGATAPIGQNAEYAPHAHGTDGLGDVGLTPEHLAPTGEEAWEQIVRLANENPHELDLLALGPLTNLALALKADAQVLSKYRSVVIMGGGGAFPAPGTLRAPDNNTDFDRVAAEMVYSAPRAEMVMVGSNVCSSTVLDESDIAQIAQSETPQAIFVTKILPKYVRAYLRRYGRGVCPMYDALTAGVLVDPSYAITIEEGPVNIVPDRDRSRAWLMAREDGGPVALEISPAPHTRAVMEVDRERFIAELVSAIVEPLPSV